MLRRFKGLDKKNDLMNQDFHIAGVESTYQGFITLWNIFSPFNDAGDAKDEIVYFREIGVDQSKALTIAEVNKNGNLFNTNKLDVKRLLKTQISLTGKKRSEDSSVVTKGLTPFYTVKDESDKTLVFESRFESGNLYSVMKVTDNEYHLCLQNDVNTVGHTQWFFFRVQNTKKDLEVQFNMLNLAKPDSLFNHGMKPLIYSEKKVEEEGIGWFRDGYNIGYYKNGIKKEKGSYYTLTFKYRFEHDDDTVYFAYWYPYTYSDLKADLIAIERNPKTKNFWVIRSLCRSLAGNSWDYLTITNKNKTSSGKPKKAVVISARVHPGETVGSWMMKGVIDFLTDPDNEEANMLRDNFVFKIIPMLNPDGVINGNYRWSLSGGDLNRRWKNPSKVLHPIIYHTKKLIKEVHEEREVLLFWDLHGHSRRKDIFMYGCNFSK